MSDHYREVLCLHVGEVDAAETDLESRRASLRFWMLEAVERGGLTVEEVADITGAPVAHVTADIDRERKWQRRVRGAG